MKNILMKFIKQVMKSDNVPVVVFGSSVNGLSYLRSYGKRNIPVLCLDHTDGPAAKSRYGCFIKLAINADDDVRGEKEADRIFKILDEHKIKPVAFGSADEWQVYIAGRSESAAPLFISLAPGQKTMESIIDKQAQYELALSVGISIPSFANAADVFIGKAEWKIFPAIIKPRWAHLGRSAIGGKALLVNSPEELNDHLTAMQKSVKIEDYIIQTVLKGGDNCLYSYLGLYEPGGKEFTGMVKRKLRQYPPFLGDGSYDMTCIDKPLEDAARKLLSAIDYKGLVGVEFKRNPDSDDFGLIEINPRTVSTNQLAINAGIDFPWIGYQMALHLHDPEKFPKPSAPAGYHSEYHHVNEERDFKTFLILRKQKKITFSEWFQSVYNAESYALWYKGDKRPFWNMVRSKIGNRWKKK